MFKTAFPFDCNNVVNLGTSNIFNFQMIQNTCILIICDWFWHAITANMVCFYVRQMYVTFKNSKESSDLAVHSTSRYFTTATNVPISMCMCINGDKLQCSKLLRHTNHVVTVLTWRFFMTAIHVVHVLLFLCINVDNSSM